MTFQDKFSKYEINNYGVRLPKIEISSSDAQKYGVTVDTSAKDFLRVLCKHGYEEKIKSGILDKSKYETYVERTKYELKIFDETNFTDYMILVWDIVNFCRTNDIPLGVGRGSAAGSFVLFLLGVTEVDPIRYGLFFERFVSKTRAKAQVIDGVTYIDGSLAPDIDLDICHDNRHRVVEYLYGKYPNRCCKLSTLSTLQSKILIKECGKIVGDMSEDDVKLVSDTIPTEFGRVYGLDEAYEHSEDFRNFCNSNKKVYRVARKLAKLVKNKSSHASGYLISFDPLTDSIPLETSNSGDIVSSFDMRDAQEICIKVDLLGLHDVTLISNICKRVGISRGSIDIDDPFIYKKLADLETPYGLFQISGDCNLRVLRDVKPRSLAELASVIALGRPGALAYVDDFANYVRTGEFQSVHPFFDNILKTTGGLPLFQEQMMAMANKIGLTLDESEQLRRCVTGDTRFLSKERGWIKIETLLDEGYEDDLFWIVSPDGEGSWKKIENIWSNGKKQIRYVEAENGFTVKATQYHQFATAEGWKARMRLTEDDYLVSSFNCPKTGNRSLSLDWAIVLAGMMTEGYFVLGAATFTNYDSDIYNQFYKSACRLFGENSISKRPCGKVISLKQEAANSLNKFMKRGLSAAKDVPEIVFRQDNVWITKFLSFAFACEGTFGERELSLTSKSSRVCHKLQLLLTQFGIRTFINTKNNPEYGDFKVVNISGSEKGVYLKIFREYLSEHIQTYKIEKLDGYIATQEKIPNSRRIQNMVPHCIVNKFINQYPFVAHKLGIASGNIFTNDVTRSKFNRLAIASKDSNWIKLANGLQCYVKVKSLKRDIREVEVFDFTVEGDSPFILANGLVIHNCVSKKKLDEMEKWEKIVRDKVEEDKLDTKVADVLWKVLDDSKSYSFNLSHSVAYATLSALGSYLKFKYPKEFFLEVLRMAQNKSDTLGEISIIDKEIKHFGIRMMPPDLVKSQLEFIIDDDCIRFGLSAIKGISEKSFEKLKSFISTDTSNKFEVFQAAKNAKLNIGIMSSLIQAGTLSSMGDNRPLLVLEAQAWNLLTPRERLYCLAHGEQYGYRLLHAIKDMLLWKNEKGKSFVKLSRFESFKEKFTPFKKIYELNSANPKFASYIYEKQLLGFSFSSTLKDLFDGRTENRLMNTYEANHSDENQYIDIVAEVREVFSSISKAKKKYCKMVIEDELGTAQVMMFDPSWSQYKDNAGVPLENDIVYIKGKVWKDNIIIANAMTVQNDKIFMKLSELKNHNEKDEN